MADYKDIITGTINNITEKVKEVAGNSSVKDIYEKGTNRAKCYARIAKLTLELNGEHEELRKVYTEIGRLYYEQARDNPEGFFAPLFAQAQEISQKIAAKNDEIDDVKASIEAESCGKDKDIDVEIGDFDDIVDAAEKEAAAPVTEEAEEEKPEE